MEDMEEDMAEEEATEEEATEEEEKDTEGSGSMKSGARPDRAGAKSGMGPTMSGRAWATRVVEAAAAGLTTRGTKGRRTAATRARRQTNGMG